MSTKGITIRGLEVFEALAATGSVAQAASRTGLSQPSVSQQLRNLETALNTQLVDHGKRPMRLTPAGKLFRTRAETALAEIRAAQSELTVMDLAHIRSLNIGIIDDFDDNITPRLATILADSLTECRFRMLTASSHELARSMERKELHIAVFARTGELPRGIVEYPLARDPFIVVAPRGQGNTPAGQTGAQALPFLRYETQQLIGKQIEAQLKRLDIRYPARFEIGSHQALMSMVARGIGWTITTPLGYMRAHRFHGEIEAAPLPFAPFSRQISLFASDDWAGTVPDNIARTMRRLLHNQMIEPALADLPFLTDELRVLDDADT